jgi:hypothetical protein
MLEFGDVFAIVAVAERAVGGDDLVEGVGHLCVVVRGRDGRSATV